MTTTAKHSEHRTARDLVDDEMRARFVRDGVVFVPGLLSDEFMALLEAGITRNMNALGPYAKTHFKDTPDEFYEDRCNYFAIPEYQILLRESPLVDVVASIFGSENVWLYFEQMFVKGEGMNKRTPWHQDLPSFCGTGRQFAACWITLEPLEQDESLEVVVGSHRGPLYGRPTQTGTNLATNTKAPDFTLAGPPIPDIDADPSKFDIVSFATKPGDVLVFHPGMLHGGGAIRAGERRTVSFRLFGDDVVYMEAPAGRLEPTLPGVRASGLVPGEPLRHSWFPQLLPRPERP